MEAGQVVNGTSPESLLDTYPRPAAAPHLIGRQSCFAQTMASMRSSPAKTSDEGTAREHDCRAPRMDGPRLPDDFAAMISVPGHSSRTSRRGASLARTPRMPESRPWSPNNGPPVAGLQPCSTLARPVLLTPRLSPGRLPTSPPTWRSGPVGRRQKYVLVRGSFPCSWASSHCAQPPVVGSAGGTNRKPDMWLVL